MAKAKKVHRYFDPAHGYDPKYGHNGRVAKDDFSIDGKSWAYRDPENYMGKRPGTTRPGANYERGDDWNPHSSPLYNPLYRYSFGEASRAGKALGIGNVDEKEEVDQILAYLEGDRSMIESPLEETEEPSREPEPLVPSTPENVEYSPELARAKTFPDMYSEALLNDRLNPMRDDYGDAAQSFLSDYTRRLLQLGEQAVNA